jgi:hypothetical protein
MRLLEESEYGRALLSTKDRSARWKFSWQQSPLAACPQEVKDGVEDGTKVGGARSPTRSRRRQNWRNPGPRRVGQVGVVESRVHRTVPLARVSALSRQTSTFQTPSKPPSSAFSAPARIPSNHPTNDIRTWTMNKANVDPIPRRCVSSIHPGW